MVDILFDIRFSPLLRYAPPRIILLRSQLQLKKDNDGGYGNMVQILWNFQSMIWKSSVKASSQRAPRKDGPNHIWQSRCSFKWVVQHWFCLVMWMMFLYRFCSNKHKRFSKTLNLGDKSLRIGKKSLRLWGKSLSFAQNSLNSGRKCLSLEKMGEKKLV